MINVQVLSTVLGHLSDTLKDAGFPSRSLLSMSSPRQGFMQISLIGLSADLELLTNLTQDAT